VDTEEGDIDQIPSWRAQQIKARDLEQEQEITMDDKFDPNNVR